MQEMIVSSEIELERLRNDLEEKRQKLKKVDQLKQSGFIFIGGSVICLLLLFSEYFIIGIIVCLIFGIVTSWYCLTIFVKMNSSKLRRECKNLESRIREILIKLRKAMDTKIRDKKRLNLIKEIKIRINYTDEFLNAMNSWGFNNSESKNAKEKRLLIEARLKDNLKKFHLVLAFRIQKLVGDRYGLMLHVGGPDTHVRLKRNSLFGGFHEWLLFTEDSNSNFTELALVEYARSTIIITKYTTLRITKNRPLMLKQQFNSFEQGHDLW